MLSKYSRWKLGSKNKPGPHTKRGPQSKQKLCASKFLLQIWKIVPEVLTGAIHKWNSALWPSNPPLQGGIKNFARFQNLRSDQYDKFFGNDKVCFISPWSGKVQMFQSKRKTVNSHHRSSPGHRSSSSSSSSSSRIGLIDWSNIQFFS